MKPALLVAFVPALAFAAGPQHFSLSARYETPIKPGAAGAIAVTFSGSDPDVHINETPAPRLKLAEEQRILTDKQPPAADKIQPFDPETAKYLDLSLPVFFPVAIAPGAPRGEQTVAAVVTYFYCSKRQGWCRKGTSDVSVTVSVP